MKRWWHRHGFFVAGAMAFVIFVGLMLTIGFLNGFGETGACHR